ncbi:MAG: MMPL family transporter [Halanaerobiales bacterium]|nr:MMPL family transporter [Halanaerobiales bacterium]
MSQKLKNFFTSLGMKFVKHKVIVLIFLIILTFVALLGAQNLRLNSSDEAFFPKDSPTIQKYDRFKEIFGNEDYVFIMIESDNIFSYKSLSYIQNLTEDIEKRLPFVEEVTSITNVDYMEANNGNLKVTKLIGNKIPKSEKKLKQIKEKALGQKSYVGSIITKDAKSTGIIINIEKLPDHIFAEVPKNFTPIQQEKWPAEKRLMKSDIYYDQNTNKGLNKVLDPQKLIAPALKGIMEKHQTENIDTYVTGTPIISYEPDVVASEEARTFGLIALIAAIVLMFILFRNFRAILSTVLVILLTMIILFGILGWANIELSILVIIIPPLILVISVSYSIHVINHFLFSFNNQGSRIEAVKYAYQEAAWPIFITSITTALGFSTFLLLKMPPLQIVGISCVIGVIIAYLLVMIITPIIFSIGKDKPVTNYKEDSKVRNKKGFQRKMSRWADFIASNVKLITAITVIMVIVLIGFSFNMMVNPDTMELIGEEVKVVNDTNYITQKLGAPYSYEIMIELSDEEMAKKSKFLKQVNNLSVEISKWESTAQVDSMVDLIKQINKTMHNNQEEYYKIPDSDRLISQYLLLYEMAGGEGIEDWTTFNYDMARMSVQVNDLNPRLKTRFSEIKKFTKENFPKGTKVTIVGNMPIMLKMMERISQGQIKSILAAVIVVTIIMMIILKSVKLGLISMLPNAIPILSITGVMGMFGIPLNFFTLIVAPMIIGIAVDDTVHYFVHFKEEYLKTSSYFEANEETFKKIGRALVFTSVILILGYGIFSISKMQAFADVAVLSVVGIFIALLGDMFLTPAIIMLLKPFGKKGDITNDQIKGRNYNEENQN